ncbi:MAG: ROK family protein [Spirochaetales bacterium]|nr:ROK family protein [Spirochaetales bacterium]
MKILDSLEQESFILNEGKGESSDEGGRKPMLYRLNADRSYSIAFHIFPNELYGVITDLKSRILKTVSSDIDSTISFEDTITLLADCCRRLAQGITDMDSLTGIAVGSHGATDHEAGITFHAPHFHNWGKHADFRTGLRTALNTDIPVLVDNQIRYQILSERITGRNKDSRNLIVIEAGVGLVAGIMSKNEIKRGIHYLAGEIGHMIINPGGELCACGGHGCFEAMVTADRIKNMATKAHESSRESEIFRNTTPEGLHIYDIFSAANNGDPLAMELMDDLAYWFAIGLTNLQLSYDPESIIIQGVYSQAGNFFLKSLKRQIRELSPLLRDEELDIRLSMLGKNRSVIGATWLLAEEYFKQTFSSLT